MSFTSESVPTNAVVTSSGTLVKGTVVEGLLGPLLFT
jgi:hypothetical protein